MMRQLASFLTIVLCIADISLAQDIEFSAQATTIQAGESAILRWSVNNADRILHSGVGKVATEGSQTVSPSASTAYTLIAEGKFGIASKTLTIEVTGARGGDYPTDFDSFRYPISGKRKDTSFLNFLDRVHRVLQDEMQSSVYGPL